MSYALMDKRGRDELFQKQNFAKQDLTVIVQASRNFAVCRSKSYFSWIAEKRKTCQQNSSNFQKTSLQH